MVRRRRSPTDLALGRASSGSMEASAAADPSMLRWARSLAGGAAMVGGMGARLRTDHAARAGASIGDAPGTAVQSTRAAVPSLVRTHTLACTSGHSGASCCVQVGRAVRAVARFPAATGAARA